MISDDKEDESFFLRSKRAQHCGRSACHLQRPDRAHARAHFGLLPSAPPPKSPKLTSNTVLSNPIFAP